MKMKKLLKATSPVGYVAVKATERKNDPARQAEAEAKAAAKADSDRDKAAAKAEANLDKAEATAQAARDKAEADRAEAEAKAQRREEVHALMEQKREDRRAAKIDAVDSGQKPIARHGLLAKLYVDRVEGGKTVYLDGAAVDFSTVGKSLTARNQAVLTITGPREQIQLRAKGSMEVKNLQAFAARVEAAKRART